MQLGLFLCLAAVPILEIVLLVKLGQWIGFWLTVAIVIGTALLGTYVLHRQGFKVLNRVMESVAAGKPPVGPAVDGAFLMMAGMLLIAPGVLTDGLGLLLLIPPLRHAIAAWSVRRFLRSAVVVRSATTFSRAQAKARPNGEQPWPGPRAEPRPERSGDGGPVIDGEFERIDERTIDPRKTTTSGRPATGSERRGDGP